MSRPDSTAANPPRAADRDPGAGAPAPPASRWRRGLRAFLWPRFTGYYLLRVVVVALLAWFVFSRLLFPMQIVGSSMEPTYHDGSYVLGWRLAYAWRDPRPGDRVMVRYRGDRVMLFKRVVAVAGEELAFRDGRLYVNGERREEPWVTLPCDWEMAPRRVAADSVYVIGDNRSMPIDNHYFGEVSLNQIRGGPLW